MTKLIMLLLNKSARVCRTLSTLTSSSENVSVSRNSDSALDKSSNLKKQFRQKRNDLFSTEQERQLKLLTKVDKIDVHVNDPAKGLDYKLKMNKNISTPLNCAMHINDSLTTYPALALVNNKPWDMHRPLIDTCELKFLSYSDADCFLVNQAYWRSCSFVLGYILETAFRDEFPVVLHSWPSANYHEGSFVYDAKIGMKGWKPTKDELKILSCVPAEQLRAKDLPFERLEVDMSVAEKIFEDNPFKTEQLRFIAQNSESKNVKIILYRVGDHVDFSKGPMINSTSQLGFFSVTAFHPFESEDFGSLVRVQGVSVPFTQKVNTWTWEIVTTAAKRMNEMPLPNRQRYEKQQR